jgi:hypothetical protein
MRAPTILAAALAAAFLSPAAAQEAFDACAVFTQADAEKVLGAAAAGDAVNPKVKRPRVVTQCTYSGFRDGKAVAATSQFKVARNNEEAQRAFEEARLQHQTKPMLLPGAEGFWAGKSGVFHMRKGRTWVTMTVGPSKLSERDANEAKKLAEILAAKL